MAFALRTVLKSSIPAGKSSVIWPYRGTMSFAVVDLDEDVQGGAVA